VRPVLLTMEGFASFRDKAELDFRDVDYFALVGRTGAGKSTVIDAITFALYGTADRWGRDNAIRDALAPTANQAKVKLVFDASGHRYVIAREVRRSGQAVMQKSVSLEALADPHGIGDADEEPGQVLADNSRTARAKIVALLGLDFDEFTKCVVLPQGKFSEFLISDPTRRRQILSRLLGEHRYGAMHRLAEQRAAEADGAARTLSGQLDRLSNPSEDDIAALREHHDELVATSLTVERAVEHLRALARDAAAVEHSLAQTRQRLAALDVTVPEGVDGLDADHEAAATALAAAESTANDAAAAASTARARQHGTPSVDLSRQLVIDHTQLTVLTEQLPTLADAHDRARADEAEQQRRSEQADREQEELRTVRDAKSAAHRTAGDAVQRLQGEIALLAATHEPPPAVARLNDDVAAADLRVAAAQEQLSAAEDASRTRRAQQIDAETLASARLTLTHVAEAQERSSRLAVLLEAEVPLRAALEQATAAPDAVEEERTHLQDQLRHLTLSATADDLRTQLHPGDACPVCDQVVAEVHTRNAVDDEPQRRVLGERVDQLDGQLRRAEAAVRGASTAFEQHHARTELLREHVAADQHALADVDAAALHATLDQARRQADQLVEADKVVEAARSTAHDAATARTRLAADEARAQRQLVAEVQRLARLDPPPLTGDDLEHEWGSLFAWAIGRRAQLVDEEKGALAAAEAAGGELAAADTALAAAREAADAARNDTRRAVRLAAEAEQRRSRCQTDRTNLLARLAGGPDASQAQELLERAVQLAADVDLAHHRDDHARGQLDQARSAAQAVGRRAADARTDLARRRDPLAAFGAPPPAGASLRQDWDQLRIWAQEAAAALGVELEAETSRLAALTSAAATESDALVAVLVAAGVDVPAHPAADLTAAQLGAGAPSWVAVAAAHAAGAVERAVADREERARLEVERAQAQERRDVAALLSRLLSPAQFEKWLTNTVMARLVADASTTLYALSGQQFTLSHDDRSEFVVVDHADGNSSRSVKTLSGGETFQASLALALALSSHMAALGAGGTSKLGSIFLDEGFGTLDPDALTVVADTLATLAQGDRLVGVVTHVAELAETIPTRFVVERDSRTSTLRKES
jgi:exonuclease SbcC